MGPVTIRVEEEVLRAIGMTLAEALQQLGTPLESLANEDAGPLAMSTLAGGGWKQ